MITEIRDLLDIHPIMRNFETADGVPIITLNMRWCYSDTPEPYTIEDLKKPLTIITELNDILYRAFINDLKDAHIPPSTIKILNDTRKKLKNAEREKCKKISKKSFFATLKQYVRKKT